MRTVALFLLVTSTSFGQFMLFGRSASLDEGKLRYEEQSVFYSISVHSTGVVDVSNDDRSIVSISPEGYIKIRQRNGITVREMTITSSDGKLHHDYRIQGISYDYDDEARDWLASVLPEIIWKTGLGAEKRVARILAEEGPEAAVKHLARVETNYARMVYFKAILNDERCTPALLAQMVKVTSKDISSSSRIAEMIELSASYFKDDPALTLALFQAVHEISSSSMASDAVKTIIRMRPPTEDGFMEAHRVIRHISSSSAQGDALEAMATAMPSSERLFDEYCETVKSVSSSSVKGRSLKTLINAAGRDKAFAWKALFESAGEISSSSVQGEVLTSAAAICPVDDATVNSFLRTAGTISSSSVQGEVVRALLAREGLTKTSLRNIAEFADSKISSSSVQKGIQDIILRQKLVE